MIRGCVIYSPKKNKGNRAKRKISKIKGKTEELTYTIQARFCPHVAADQTKLLEESVTTSAYICLSAPAKQTFFRNAGWKNCL